MSDTQRTPHMEAVSEVLKGFERATSLVGPREAKIELYKRLSHLSVNEWKYLCERMLLRATPAGWPIIGVWLEEARVIQAKKTADRLNAEVDRKFHSSDSERPSDEDWNEASKAFRRRAVAA